MHIYVDPSVHIFRASAACTGPKRIPRPHPQNKALPASLLRESREWRVGRGEGEGIAKQGAKTKLETKTQKSGKRKKRDLVKLSRLFFTGLTLNKEHNV